MVKLLNTSHPWLQPSESSEQFLSRGMFKLNAISDADLLLCSLSHFECDGHTVHMLTQWASTAPTDQYSEVVIVHTSAFQSTLLGCQVTSCCANDSHYINNGWTFSRQTSYKSIFLSWITYQNKCFLINKNVTEMIIYEQIIPYNITVHHILFAHFLKNIFRTPFLF